jgi:hypothetical protein
MTRNNSTVNEFLNSKLTYVITSVQINVWSCALSFPNESQIFS